MRNSDRKLGMDRSITRRDVIHGIGAIGAGFAIPGFLLGCAKRPAGESNYYPPALTGLRGNHDGSFEVAHALAREGRTDWGSVQKPDSLVYDLVIVGAGHIDCADAVPGAPSRTLRPQRPAGQIRQTEVVSQHIRLQSQQVA